MTMLADASFEGRLALRRAQSPNPNPPSSPPGQPPQPPQPPSQPSEPPTPGLDPPVPKPMDPQAHARSRIVEAHFTVH
jgi:hypothetical protein